MGIKSNRTIASYFNRFGTTGLDAVSPVPVPVYTEATGGIISDYTDSGTHYRAHIFTSSGTFDVSQVGGGGVPATVEILQVAGGGGGGQHNGGGGGAGGLQYAPAQSVSVGPYSIVVGGGGYGSSPKPGAASPYIPGGNGTPSTSGGLVTEAQGGGGGANNSGPTQTAHSGGSGGGSGDGSPVG